MQNYIIYDQNFEKFLYKIRENIYTTCDNIINLDLCFIQEKISDFLYSQNKNNILKKQYLDTNKICLKNFIKDIIQKRFQRICNKKKIRLKIDSIREKIRSKSQSEQNLDEVLNRDNNSFKTPLSKKKQIYKNSPDQKQKINNQNVKNSNIDVSPLYQITEIDQISNNIEKLSIDNIQSDKNKINLITNENLLELYFSNVLRKALQFIDEKSQIHFEIQQKCEHDENLVQVNLEFQIKVDKMCTAIKGMMKTKLQKSYGTNANSFNQSRDESFLNIQNENNDINNQVSYNQIYKNNRLRGYSTSNLINKNDFQKNYQQNNTNYESSQNDYIFEGINLNLMEKSSQSKANQVLYSEKAENVNQQKRNNINNYSQNQVFSQNQYTTLIESQIIQNDEIEDDDENENKSNEQKNKYKKDNNDHNKSIYTKNQTQQQLNSDIDMNSIQNLQNYEIDLLQKQHSSTWQKFQKQSQNQFKFSPNIKERQLTTLNNTPNQFQKNNNSNYSFTDMNLMNNNNISNKMNNLQQQYSLNTENNNNTSNNLIKILKTDSLTKTNFKQSETSIISIDFEENLDDVLDRQIVYM
ncbi:hypothetical protein PPERSA_00138 [Pseudocohnilembus persalinus]|uniref:Uncharacterized protein n=1 Tax=Pseudocohnilembus persalinus TaxID=266149 RepID=A0A0V0QCL8_PSEPJ|nr:hypothetical protein PPERSA_00138 [Pseudocohnilembus persalinus]|eukprot:KRW99971.1 hypothetical protein PPERSA_00138 [Pseudocohnilembus persalinus]